jgi:F420-non-reducing hydrogenase large subunit
MLRQTEAARSPVFAKEIIIEPVTRIEGRAKIGITLDDTGSAARVRFHMTSMRGFEKFLVGRPAEEAPGILACISGVCPLQRHLAANQAVEGCFGTKVPPAGRLLRELSQVLAHIGSKTLHFFFLAGPDYLVDSNRYARNIFGIVGQDPELAKRVMQTRYRAQMMLEKLAGRCIQPDAIVPGGFSRPMSCLERDELYAGALEQLEFAGFAVEFAKERVFPRLETELMRLGDIESGFLAMVNTEDGSLSLSDGALRLMRPDGSFHEFWGREYSDFLGEHVEPWSYSKFHYAQGWGEGFSMDLDNPLGIYRTNSLARINVADCISTPLAQAEFVEFRSRFGRPAQSTMLYHRARLIELLHCCEKAVELLEDPRITADHVRNEAVPREGRGVGCVESPRGTLIHDYSTDKDGFITRANLIVGTSHNLAPINMSVTRAARDLIRNGEVTEQVLNRIEMAVRAYNP